MAKSVTRKEPKNRRFLGRYLKTKVGWTETEKRRRELKESRARLEEEMKNPDEKLSTVTTNFNKLYDGMSCLPEIAEIATKLESLPAVEREVINSLWDSLGGLREYFTKVSFTLSNYDQWNFKQVTLFYSANHQYGNNTPEVEFEDPKNQVQIQEEIRNAG